MTATAPDINYPAAGRPLQMIQAWRDLVLESGSKANKRKEVPMAEKAARKQEIPQETARGHEAGQEAFRAILSEDVEWKPFAALPPKARLAVLVGQPSEPVPYVVRVKVPHDVKLMPHRHPEDRIYTVISGVLISDWAINSMRISWRHIRPAL